MKFKALNLKNNQNAAGRPKKNLIPKTPYIMLQKKKRTKSEIVQENFLSYLKEKYQLEPQSKQRWAGSALHLLELADHITPGMHEAAKSYFKFSKSIHSTGPKRSAARYDDPSLRGRSTALIEKDYDQTFEMHWNRITDILESHQTKKLMDDLKSPEMDLPCLETLLTTETVLRKLRKSLGEIENYLSQSKNLPSTS